MKFPKPLSLEYKAAPMWADGLRTGDVFYYPPNQKTYLIFMVDEINADDPLGQKFLAYEYTPYSEFLFNVYWLTKKKLYPTFWNFMRHLRNHGFVTAPEGITVSLWPLLRTFTLDRRVRQNRLTVLRGYANKTVYYRDRVRELANELSMEGACPHSSGILPHVCASCYSDRTYPQTPATAPV